MRENLGGFCLNRIALALLAGFLLSFATEQSLAADSDSEHVPRVLKTSTLPGHGVIIGDPPPIDPPTRTTAQYPNCSGGRTLTADLTSCVCPGTQTWNGMVCSVAPNASVSLITNLVIYPGYGLLASAGNKVYFNNGGSVLFTAPGPITTLAVSPSGLGVLAAVGNKVYFNNGGSVLFTAPGPITSLAVSPSGLGVLAAVGNKVYFNNGGSVLFTAPGPITSLVADPSGLGVLAAVGNKVYFNNGGSVLFTAPGAITSLVADTSGYGVLAAVGNKVYFNNGGSVLSNIP